MLNEFIRCPKIYTWISWKAGENYLNNWKFNNRQPSVRFSFFSSWMFSLLIETAVVYKRFCSTCCDINKQVCLHANRTVCSVLYGCNKDQRIVSWQRLINNKSYFLITVLFFILFFIYSLCLFHRFANENSWFSCLHGLNLHPRQLLNCVIVLTQYQCECNAMRCARTSIYHIKHRILLHSSINMNVQK